MMSNYVIVVYVSFWSWHVHGSHSVYLPKPGVTLCNNDIMIFVTFISIHFVIICVVLLWRTYETHPTLYLKSGCDRSGIRGNVDCRTKPR
jgi:TM2 domain-containing membrane protein YozV